MNHYQFICLPIILRLLFVAVQVGLLMMGHWQVWVKVKIQPIFGLPCCAPRERAVSTQRENGSKITVDGDCSHEIKRCWLLGRNVMTNLDSIFKSRNYFANKGPSSQGYGFSCGHVWMWELDCEESWALKNWCFWTAVLEKTLESPLDCQEIQPVHSEGDQSWVFFGRTDAKAETPILWPPDAKSWLIGKDPDAGRIWGQEEKGTTEDEMAGWHHRLDGREFQWTLSVGDGQGGLACCDSWGHKESDTTVLPFAK